MQEVLDGSLRTGTAEVVTDSSSNLLRTSSTRSKLQLNSYSSSHLGHISQHQSQWKICQLSLLYG